MIAALAAIFIENKCWIPGRIMLGKCFPSLAWAINRTGKMCVAIATIPRFPVCLPTLQTGYSQCSGAEGGNGGFLGVG